MLDTEGAQLVSYEQSQPDHDTPEQIVDELKEAARALKDIAVEIECRGELSTIDTAQMGGICADIEELRDRINEFELRPSC